MPASVELGELDMRVALGVAVEHVAPAEPGHEVAGEGVAADDHPRVAPDRRWRRRGSARAPARPTPPAPRSSQSGMPTSSTSTKSRSSESSAPGTVSMSVTQTGTPLVPQPPDVELAVLLLVGDDEVGLERRDGVEVGVLRPPHPRTSRSAGCVHQSVAPTNRSGQVAAIASVMDGTSDTTRLGLGASSAAYPRSSTASHANSPERASRGCTGRRPLAAVSSPGVRRCGGTGHRPRRTPRSPAGGSTRAPRA